MGKPTGEKLRYRMAVSYTHLWLAVLYGVAGAYSGRNPWEVLKHYGPAYLTAVGTMSSAATLACLLYTSG